MPKNVLLIEDDKFLGTLLKNRLEKEGFFVSRAVDGESAIDILRSDKKPDIVLLDIILPKKNGFEILEEIKQNPLLTDLPVIIISNLGQDSDITKGKELGAIDYYVKAQISIDNLILKIKDFCAK